MDEFELLTEDRIACKVSDPLLLSAYDLGHEEVSPLSGAVATRNDPSLADGQSISKVRLRRHVPDLPPPYHKLAELARALVRGVFAFGARGEPVHKGARTASFLAFQDFDPRPEPFRTALALVFSGERVVAREIRPTAPETGFPDPTTVSWTAARGLFTRAVVVFRMVVPGDVSTCTCWSHAHWASLGTYTLYE